MRQSPAHQNYSYFPGLTAFFKRSMVVSVPHRRLWTSAPKRVGWVAVSGWWPCHVFCNDRLQLPRHGSLVDCVSIALVDVSSNRAPANIPLTSSTTYSRCALRQLYIVDISIRENRDNSRIIPSLERAYALDSLALSRCNLIHHCRQHFVAHRTLQYFQQIPGCSCSRLLHDSCALCCVERSRTISVQAQFHAWCIPEPICRGTVILLLRATLDHYCHRCRLFDSGEIPGNWGLSLFHMSSFSGDCCSAKPAVAASSA